MDARPDDAVRRQLVAFASRPEVRTKELLRLVLDRALEETRSDAGGGLYLFDRAAGRTPVLRARCPAGDIGADAEVPPPAATVFRSSVSLYLGAADAAAAAGPGAASSLWVPLREGRRQVMGVLALAASRQHAYGDRTIARIETLAADAVAAIDRVLLRDALAELGSGQDVVGTSAALLALELRAKQAGSLGDGAVLITGERGSGKELTAWAVHAWSRRRERPFVPVLASALSEGLVADELFGHERHAFTGAAAARLGRFGAADGGSLFLDEIGDLPAAAQASLLRIVDKGELPRIGRDLPLKVDVRVIAATNRDLGAAMARGEFRRDLHDRLSVLEIRVPPLRERREDIPLLVGAFLRKHCASLHRQLWLAEEGHCGSCGSAFGTACVSRDFIAALQAYDWPGNVRELENVIAAVVAGCPDDVLDVAQLPPRVLDAAEGRRPGRGGGGAMPGLDLTLDGAVREHILRILTLSGNNQTQAARLLGIPLSTMRNKLKRLGVPLTASKQAETAAHQRGR